MTMSSEAPREANRAAILAHREAVRAALCDPRYTRAAPKARFTADVGQADRPSDDREARRAANLAEIMAYRLRVADAVSGAEAARPCERTGRAVSRPLLAA